MTSSNIKEFNLEVQRYSETKPEEELIKLHKKIAFIALARIIERTPVDKGDASGNWHVTVNAPYQGIQKLADPLASGIVYLNRIKAFTVVFISNNIEYITILEEGGFIPPDPGPSKDKRIGREGKILVSGGYSMQAAQGMVGVTVEELKVMFP